MGELALALLALAALHGARATGKVNQDTETQWCHRPGTSPPSPGTGSGDMGWDGDGAVRSPDVPGPDVCRGCGTGDSSSGTCWSEDALGWLRAAWAISPEGWGCATCCVPTNPGCSGTGWQNTCRDPRLARQGTGWVLVGAPGTGCPGARCPHPLLPPEPMENDSEPGKSDGGRKPWKAAPSLAELDLDTAGTAVLTLSWVSLVAGTPQK